MTGFPQTLLDGYRSFMHARYAQEQDRYRRLADAGQSPKALVIACCDSRAAPETIFDVGPGELFVVRNVANLVPTYDPDREHDGISAALEFALNGLKVRNVIVMGHGRCGGIQAALNEDGEPLSPGNFVGHWMALVKPLAEEMNGYSALTAAERQTALERISIRNSIKNLRTFPWVSDLEEKDELSLHGAWFDIGTGELWVMDGASGDFRRPDPQ
ncbi:carbonic anhydrase [Pararhizobium haloflavum]|uniref:carbonic anhydrase n=1 Tax=Pararhizobium haloflavum TaxID=2037914 RepID=UPI000C1A386B|nr:carbonic anhydrase [Pararhizobium haloflavum]